ncbi:carboxymuconolactone decarboxylase family protein [Streptomyces sp. 6N223]|uniref:carboxymuconolactone decarboxylase family protein n=1 Tax=Streptomyces sp. 6N223 TaxID=3457412 RepID=UPI003FD045B0
MGHEQRMTNPAIVLDAQKQIHALVRAAQSGGVPEDTMELVHLRASQINGCSYCVDYGVRDARKRGMADEKLFGVSAWREMPYFTDAERAALALTEAATRLSDRSDPVPDAIWEEAARHYDEKALSSLILWIATTNLFNRINATVRQAAGQTQVA